MARLSFKSFVSLTVADRFILCCRTTIHHCLQKCSSVSEKALIGQEVVETNVLGTVKWFSPKRGYGFISRNDNSQEVFVHFTRIAKKNPYHNLRSLDDGETVLFDVASLKSDLQRLHAWNVRGPDGGPVRGSPMADQFIMGTSKALKQGYYGESESYKRPHWSHRNNWGGNRDGGAGSSY